MKKLTAVGSIFLIYIALYESILPYVGRFHLVCLPGFGKINLLKPLGKSVFQEETNTR